MFNWYAKIRAQAEASNPEPSPIEKLLLKKEIPTEVFSEEFEWVAKERVRNYHYMSTRDYDTFIAITLTGRWQIEKTSDGRCYLSLEVTKDVLIKDDNYLSGKGGIEVITYWLAEDKIEVEALSNTTINICGE